MSPENTSGGVLSPARMVANGSHWMTAAMQLMLVTILLTGCMQAGDDGTITSGFVNGRFWQSLSDGMKTSFVIGFAQSLLYAKTVVSVEAKSELEGLDSIDLAMNAGE